MTNAPYAGDLIADEALKLLTENSNAVLIDVRTDNEHTNIGIPDLSGLDKQPQLISWQLSPTMEINENFIAIMKDLGTEADAPLIFLCRKSVV